MEPLLVVLTERWTSITTVMVFTYLHTNFIWHCTSQSKGLVLILSLLTDLGCSICSSSSLSIVDLPPCLDGWSISMSLYFNAAQQPLCPSVSSETQFTCCQRHLYGPKMDQMSWLISQARAWVRVCFGVKLFLKLNNNEVREQNYNIMTVSRHWEEHWKTEWAEGAHTCIYAFEWKQAQGRIC